ncbi:hypothetical protein TNCV_4892221 [Trichonephila clavipes]|nr:hypothetical protein TNCV_4892221 [Trichonephila clavipes]
MTRNRYLEIKSLIHFADNNEAKSKANDRAFKIRKLITEMNANFQKWEIFDKHLSIDEMMIRYYGHYFKQYIKEEFGTVIEDDDDTNIDSEKEERKLELAIVKKISTIRSTVQKAAISNTIQ